MLSVGVVIALSASQITCLGLVDGDGPEIGQLVRVRAPGIIIYGSVNRLSIDAGDLRRRTAVVDLLGEYSDGSFQRGVSVYPSLGAEVVVAPPEDYDIVYSRPARAAVRIGALAMDASRSAYIVTDDLLTKHFAILGATGSGKSCTVALVLRALLQSNPFGHVVVLDPHAEYSSAFPDMAMVFDTARLNLPIWMMDFEETSALLVRSGSPQEAESQLAILKESLLEARRRYVGDGVAAAYVTVDTPVPYRPGDLIRILDTAMGKLDKPDNSIPYLRLKSRLESLLADQRYAFMFGGGYVVRDALAEVISSLLRIPTEGRPMSIIDLSGVPAEVTDIVVSMLTRMIFDFALWSDRGQMPPVLLVCEEAHRYVPADATRGFASTRRALERIAKEGRKYGVALGLVTQRPSELSPSILSQCGTLFALRMGNERDLAIVSATLPDNARGLVDALPALRRQDALVVGEGVSVPVRVHLDFLPPEFRPRSSSAKFAQAWSSETGDVGFVEDGVNRWRRQGRVSAEAKPDPAPPRGAGSVRKLAG